MSEEQACQLGLAFAEALALLFNRLEKRVCHIEDTVTSYTPRRHITDRVKQRHRDVIWFAVYPRTVETLM